MTLPSPRLDISFATDPLDTPIWGAYANAVLGDGSVAYWRLGESSGTSAADATGNAHTGTYQNTPTLGVTGAITNDTDTAVTFSGASSEYVSVPDSASLRGFSAITLECWYYATVAPDADVLIAKDSTSAGAGDYYLLFAHDSTLNFGVKTTAGFITNNFASTPATLNAWTYVVVTYDGANFKLYKNGALVETVADAKTLLMNTTEALAIAAANAGSLFFSGSIDEVAIYGSALSAARVAAHYAAATSTGGAVGVRVYSYDIARGRNNENSEIQAGTMTAVVDNDDRALEPFYADGSFYGGVAPGNVVPSKVCRVVADDITIFYGLVESIECEIFGGKNVATVTATDFMYYLQTVDVDREVVFTNSAINTATVATNTLNNISWPAAMRVIGTGSYTAEDVQDPDVQTALSVLQSLALAEGGTFYIDRSGYAVFEGATTRSTQTRSNTVQLTIGRFGAWILEDAVWGILEVTTILGPSGVAIAGKLNYFVRRADIVNRVRVSGQSGTVYTYNNTASQTAYLRATRDLLSLVLDSDTDVQARGSQEISRYAQPAKRIEGLTLNVNTLSASSLALEREIGDRVQVVIHQPQGGDDISEGMLIERVEHRYDGNLFMSKFSLSPGFFYQFWILGSANFSQLDTTAIVGL